MKYSKGDKFKAQYLTNIKDDMTLADVYNKYINLPIPNDAALLESYRDKTKRYDAKSELALLSPECIYSGLSKWDITGGGACSANMKDGGVTDTLWLDIDSGISIDQFINDFKQYQFFWYTTANHGFIDKDKNPENEDRFRAVLQLPKFTTLVEIKKRKLDALSYFTRSGATVPYIDKKAYGKTYQKFMLPLFTEHYKCGFNKGEPFDPYFDFKHVVPKVSKSKSTAPDGTFDTFDNNNNNSKKTKFPIIDLIISQAEELGHVKNDDWYFLPEALFAAGCDQQQVLYIHRCLRTNGQPHDPKYDDEIELIEGDNYRRSNDSNDQLAAKLVRSFKTDDMLATITLNKKRATNKKQNDNNALKQASDNHSQLDFDAILLGLPQKHIEDLPIVDDFYDTTRDDSENNGVKNIDRIVKAASSHRFLSIYAIVGSQKTICSIAAALMIVKKGNKRDAGKRKVVIASNSYKQADEHCQIINNRGKVTNNVKAIVIKSPTRYLYQDSGSYSITYPVDHHGAPIMSKGSVLWNSDGIATTPTSVKMLSELRYKALSKRDKAKYDNPFTYLERKSKITDERVALFLEKIDVDNCRLNNLHNLQQQLRLQSTKYSDLLSFTQYVELKLAASMVNCDILSCSSEDLVQIGKMVKDYSKQYVAYLTNIDVDVICTSLDSSVQLQVADNSTIIVDDPTKIKLYQYSFGKVNDETVIPVPQNSPSVRLKHDRSIKKKYKHVLFTTTEQVVAELIEQNFYSHSVTFHHLYQRYQHGIKLVTTTYRAQTSKYFNKIMMLKGKTHIDVVRKMYPNVTTIAAGNLGQDFNYKTMTGQDFKNVDIVALLMVTNPKEARNDCLNLNGFDVNNKQDIQQCLINLNVDLLVQLLGRNQGARYVETGAAMLILIDHRWFDHVDSIEQSAPHIALSRVLNKEMADSICNNAVSIMDDPKELAAGFNRLSPNFKAKASGIKLLATGSHFEQSLIDQREQKKQLRVDNQYLIRNYKASIKRACDQSSKWLSIKQLIEIKQTEYDKKDNGDTVEYDKKDNGDTVDKQIFEMTLRGYKKYFKIQRRMLGASSKK